eukprot:3252632-Prymnesium_polylepis.1
MPFLQPPPKRHEWDHTRSHKAGSGTALGSSCGGKGWAGVLSFCSGCWDGYSCTSRPRDDPGAPRPRGM